MPLCKRCGKGFHVCSNCSLNYEWESLYCSQKCWELSDEYVLEKETLAKAEGIVDALSYEQCLLLYRCVSNDNILSAFIDIVLGKMSEKSA